jgi:hypothetical protein
MGAASRNYGNEIGMLQRNSKNEFFEILLKVAPSRGWFLL